LGGRYATLSGVPSHRSIGLTVRLAGLGALAPPGSIRLRVGAPAPAGCVRVARSAACTFLELERFRGDRTERRHRAVYGPARGRDDGA
jgi:hypothetical protein